MYTGFPPTASTKMDYRVWTFQENKRKRERESESEQREYSIHDEGHVPMSNLFQQEI
jgi:hypothetical protein